jgi:hypothetical protein
MNTLRIAMLAATSVLLSTASAFAQASHMRMHIPFAFAAGESRLPAGDYRISVDTTFQRFLIQREGGSSIYLLAQRESSRKVSDRATLVFNKYGDRYFLKSIARAGDDRSFECAQSRAELEMASTGVPAEVAFVRAAAR